MFRFSCIGVVVADVYDHFMPHYKSGCQEGCVEWSSVSEAAAMFAGGIVPEHAGSQCAMPSVTAGAHECDCKEKDADLYMTDSYAGAWCFCQDGSTKYCTPPESTVEQLNLQLATPSVVVAAFVTYESLPSSPALGMIGASEDEMMKVEGVSHLYQPPGRSYIMHYVPFRNLKPRQRYFYKVKSGSQACQWTQVFSFRAPYLGGETRIATYGDMGHSRYNNMGNLKADCDTGIIDAIVHMGDHAYNLGMTTDRRGDAYMNVFQPVLQSCPWLPIIGNHEKSDGDHGKRYEQIAAGSMIGEQGVGVTTTADTALGLHLSLGSLYGAGLHSSRPSNTSRYTSTDLGLIHMVAIDLNHFDADQQDWLKQDLAVANANRQHVPWIIVMGHYQVYHSKTVANWNMSAEAFFSEKGETAKEQFRFESCEDVGLPDCETLGEWVLKTRQNLEPILIDYNVDIYNAGHVHDYEATWPMKNGKACQNHFNDPTCPVFIVEGNGGVPGCSGDCHVEDCSSVYDGCRVGSGALGCGAYGRITASDALTLRYDHVANSNGEVLDTFTIKRSRAPAPTPIPPPTPPVPTPSPGNCPRTCHHRSCDEWYKRKGTTCAENEENFGCDCSGCKCPGDVDVIM